jgi:hypothetical protein
MRSFRCKGQIFVVLRSFLPNIMNGVCVYVDDVMAYHVGSSNSVYIMYLSRNYINFQ